MATLRMSFDHTDRSMKCNNNNLSIYHNITRV